MKQTDNNNHARHQGVSFAPVNQAPSTMAQNGNENNKKARTSECRATPETSTTPDVKNHNRNRVLQKRAWKVPPTLT